MGAVTASDVGIEFSINRKQKRSARDTILKGRRIRSSQRFWALRHVSFHVEAGESVGLIGANGSGKTTLLKIVGGVMAPDEGSLTVGGQVASMLSLGAGFSPGLTAKENIYMTSAIYGLSRKEIEERFDEVVEYAGIGEFIDTPLRHFSSGMRVRLGFSLIREIDAPIVLLDEVLAVGDRAFSKKARGHVESMKDEGKTLFIVSHQAKNLKKLCNRILVLNKGKLIHDGDVAEGLDKYQNLKG